MEKLNKLLEEYPNGKGDLDSLKFLRPFIKWLVENDKIETHEIRFDNYEGTEFDKVDSTIMLLSIQDNPIEFLVSILK